MAAPYSPSDLAARQAELFTSPSHLAARMMIGWTIALDGVGGRIVETEAYHYSDPASHSFSGPTPRNAVMFGPPGVIYVYRSYGIHWCMNLVCGDEPGSAVLLRALEPTEGLDLMIARRGLEAPRLLCSGPGRLCQALGVTRAQNGMKAFEPPFALTPGPAGKIAVGPRIGITKAVDVPWRFGEAGSRFLSKPFPKA
ncbi:DNA-3-methyladenine glycosylase [Phenylobacterium sp.]|uniref:DNA-3-methyladenine glycosylase n=1 Tax=Phenylobacterium sp. TaxID=1871053 RepID=UPI0012037F77|nr:DNA-3-methyladenine glycosylase [Phenylobacterium sp.]THD64614.1 MAG: DNA-3-methyladenine glycosylase [Phenylobacterium sp.]